MKQVCLSEKSTEHASSTELNLYEPNKQVNFILPVKNNFLRMTMGFVAFILFFSFTEIAMAQRAPIRWGKILPYDTSMVVYKKDPNAPAIVLCDYCTAEIGPRTKYFRHIRIKILKTEGLKYATAEIPYRFIKYYDEISSLRAHTINVDSLGKIVTSKVKSKNIHEQQTDDWNKKKIIEFPNVKVGSIIEYSYYINSFDFVKLRDWYFQTTIPTLWSEYRVSVPRRFNYLVTFQKGLPLSIEDQKSYAAKLQWLYNTKTNSVRYELLDKKYILYESPNNNIKVYYATGESFNFIMQDQPALEPKPGMVALTDFYPAVRVHLYLAEGNFPGYYRYILSTAKEDFDWSNPSLHIYDFQGFVAYWLPTWEEANKQWLNSNQFGQQLKKAINCKSILSKVADLEGKDLEKAKVVYQYVKDSISWDGTYSMYAYQDIDKVFRKRAGNSGEINLLLISLLRRVGINAEPVLIKTLDQGRVENLYPVFGQFNHVIATIEINGTAIYLDATGKDSSFDTLPWNVNHADGFLVKRENYKWVDVDRITKLPEKAKEI